MVKARIALLLVSHSLALAAATEALVRQMTEDRLPIALAAGTGPERAELGTDPLAILEAAESLAACESILVLMDVGSAVLSAEMARDLAEEPLRGKLHLCAAPFVEGALAAGVAAAAGLAVAAVAAEAESGLLPKQAALGEAPAAAGAASPPETAPSAEGILRTVTLQDPQGLHLRPAAGCVAAAARFSARVTLGFQGREAGLESLTGLMALGVPGGGEVMIRASGPQAAAAAEAIAGILGAASAAGAEAEAAAPPDAAGRQGLLPIAPGRIAGPLFLARRELPPLPAAPALPPAEGWAQLERAIATASAALAGEGILAAQAALLADPAILEPTRHGVFAERLHPAVAWNRAIEQAAAGYAALESPYLRARAQDVREVGHSVLALLLGGSGLAWPETPAIILVDELSAAEAAALPPTVLGVLDRRGGRTSHAAILLRAAGLPCLGGVTLDPPPRAVAFDGGTGELIADPDAETQARFQPTAASGAAEGAAGPACLALPDGTRLEFWANVTGAADAARAARAGAFGIGLARTEMLFLDRADCPAEEEQAARIGAMLAPFKGRPVTVRLLDAGADKPVPFLRLAPEENPALGVRGVRALLGAADFTRAHLRAILRGGRGHDLRVMVPMVTFPEEMLRIRAWLAEAVRELGEAAVPPLGAMVEVPAAALSLAELVPCCDFFSIGTNDLTQYVMAAERGHPALGAFADPSHPAVLDLCARVVRDAGERPVSVCGEAAGDPAAARLLVRAGIRKLSMGAARLGAVRALWQPAPSAAAPEAAR
ncbi:dihydroxyacetone kinase phosphoryl donor subunit DhaM [Acidisoma sp. C75]